MMRDRPLDVLAEAAEPVPSWLSGDAGCINPWSTEVMDSRIFFYPGSGLDGSPIQWFAAQRACHCFVYVDLVYTARQALDECLNHGLRGYRPIRHLLVTQSSLGNCAEMARVPGESPEAHADRVRGVNFFMGFPGAAVSGGATFVVFEREPGFPSSHGADRIALLYVQGEAIELFWRMFAARLVAPYAMLLRRYMTYDFLRDKSLREVATNARCLPKWIMGDGERGDISHCWPEYTLAAERPFPAHRRRDFLFQRIAR